MISSDVAYCYSRCNTLLQASHPPNKESLRGHHLCGASPRSREPSKPCPKGSAKEKSAGNPLPNLTAIMWKPSFDSVSSDKQELIYIPVNRWLSRCRCAMCFKSVTPTQSPNRLTNIITDMVDLHIGTSINWFLKLLLTKDTWYDSTDINKNLQFTSVSYSPPKSIQPNSTFIHTFWYFL